LAKTAAAYGRSLLKDWYDIAFVLLHNDAGGPAAAASLTRDKFEKDLVGGMRTALDELAFNFELAESQGPIAYAMQMKVDHPDSDYDQLCADAILAVRTLCSALPAA
jgi:hypothetical protein